MIVRISSEGQYKLSSSLLDEVSAMDDALVARITEMNGDEFSERYAEMLSMIRERGNPLDAAELVESHVIMPPADISVEEARRFFTGDGLIPN